MNEFSYHILPIIHAYDASISRLQSYAWLWSYVWLQAEDATLFVCPTPIGRHDSDRISWLQSRFPTPIDVMTPVVSLDSGRTSWLWPMSVPHVLSPQLWKTMHGQVRWLQHLTARTLSRKQTGRDAWLIQHSNPQHRMASHVQVLGHVPCDRQTLNPAWSERNPSSQKDSIPLQLGRIKVFECLIRRAKALCRVTMTLITSHTWEKFLAQQTEQGPNPGCQRLWMLYELGAWRPQSWALS
jgi:hypothetical protein